MNDTPAEGRAPGNGGIELDEVVIDGNTFRVRKEIADEIIALRMGGTAQIIDRIKAIEPGETETVVITTPSNVSHEFMDQVAQMAKMSFPTHGIAVMPEGLNIHTKEGFRDLIVKVMDLVEAVKIDDTVSPEVRTKGNELLDYVTGKGLTDGEG